MVAAADTAATTAVVAVVDMEEDTTTVCLQNAIFVPEGEPGVLHM